MRKNLLEFLYGDTVVHESNQARLGEQVIKLFEEAADEEAEEMVASKQPLSTALKELGINKEIDAKVQACELTCDSPEEFHEFTRILFDPENLHTLAKKGWVPAHIGDVAMTFEPAQLKIGFIEIATADTNDTEKAPDLEKVLKDAQKFSATEPEHDDTNPVEFDDKGSTNHRKGMGDAKDGAAPEGKPKGSAKNESRQHLSEYGGNWCSNCKAPARSRRRGQQICCEKCGHPMKTDSSPNPRAKNPAKMNRNAKDVAESLLEMTGTASIPCNDGPPPPATAVNWQERMKKLKKRRGEIPDINDNGIP